MRQSVTVRDGWEGIVTALASAEPETVVELERGTYSGSSTLHIPQGVTILGRAAVLDFSGTGPVIAAHDVARVAVEDETIDAGRADIPFCRQPGEDPFDPSEEQTWVEWGLIWFQQTDRASLSNVSIMGCGKTVPGVYVSESAGTSLESLQVDHARHGVVFANARGGRIKRGQFFENDLFGIVLTQSQGISIVSNRCHDNTQSGILLVSSDSEAVEDNECWGNGSSGIALQRDERSPDAASHARLTGNRCHDNTQSGIVLFSPDSEAVEDNECWGNGSSGIALQRDERSPDAASHARLTGNRCHDNMQSGIALVSSDSEAVEDNECWGNGSSGIALQRAERSLDAASHAWLTGNRCHDNARAGYAIDAGGEVDIAEDNQAYRNGEASVTIDPSGRKVQDISWPFVEADESPAETQTRLRAGAASGALAARLADCVSLPDSDALARFLYGSGSLFDLKRLLDAKNTQETDSSAEIAAESVVYTLDRNRPSATDEKTVYRFQQTGTAGLRRVVWDKVAAHVISDRPSAWLIGAFGDAGGEIEQIVEDAVQANGVNVDAFAPGEAIPTGRLDLLRALQIGSARIVPPLVVSCNGRSEQAQIKEQPEAPFLEPPPVLGWRGWIARLGFVLRTPTYLLTLIGLLAASFVVAVAVGAWKRYPDPLADPVTLALEAVFSNIDDIQLSDILMLCAVTAGTIMAGLVAFANRFLPWHLQFRPRQRKEDGAGSPPQRERPWHRWINRRLFRKNAVSLVFLRDLREWPEDDRAALQSIFENRPKDTSLIVVVDCPTRSALDRSLLFPLDAPGGGPAAEMTNVEVIACLGNEPGFITEHAATTPEAQQRLLGIFGDRAATRLEQIRGDILSEEYLPGDLLPMICIGYSHYFPFSLRHRSTTAATRHSEEVRKTLDRYVTLYSGGAQRSATWLSENAPLQQWIDEAREASCTRLFLKRKGRQESYSVYGRFQLRSEMASLVSAVFENDQPGLTDYVRAMLRCGELQAISAAIEALEAENGKIMHPNRALAAIKGALFLRDEHKGRGENSTDTDRKRAEIVDAMWEQLCRLIDLLPVAPDDPDLFLQAQLYSASLHARHPLPSVSAVLEADKGGAANFARLLSKAKLRFQNSDRKLASNLAQSDLRSMMALALDAFSGSVDRALTRASFKAKSLAELIDGADGREDLIAVCGRHRSLGPELLATVLSNAVRNAKTDEDRIELALVLDANLPLLGALRDVDRPRGYTDMKNENLSTYIDLLAAPALRDMCQSDGMSAGYVSMVELMFGSTGHLFGTERQTDRVEFWANPSMSYSISL